MRASFRGRYDAIVVGGGHNGLVAAAYLARAGQSVLVLERNDWIGGATTSQQSFPGFDASVSRYAYLISLLSPIILDELGLSFQTSRRAIASFTAFERDGRQGGLVISNLDESASRDSVVALTGAESGWREYQAFQSIAAAFAECVWPGMLQPLQGREAWKQRFDTPILRKAWQGIVEEPLGRMLEQEVRDDVLRGLLFTDAKIGVFTRPDDPSLLQNRCYMYHVIGNGTGEWRVPVGGMSAFVDALVARATGDGAEIVARAEATAVHQGARSRTVEIRHDGREHHVEARRVLMATGARTSARLLGDPYAPADEDEGSVMKVNMLLRKLPRLRCGVDERTAFTGSFHVDEGYDAMRETWAQADGGEVPGRPPFETYCHSLTDPSILGPGLQRDGYQTLTLFGLDAPYRLFNADNNESVKREYMDRYVAALNRVTVDPFEDCLARDASGQPCLEVKSPLDLEREVDLDAGNIFHTAPSWFFTDDPALEGSWGVETLHAGVYRCGSSIPRGGAVSGIPGRSVAMKIFEEEGLQ